MMFISTRFSIRAVLALALSSSVSGHSWIDCLDTDRSKIYDNSAEYIYGGSKGNGFCQGYAIDFPGRGAGDIGPTYTHKMLKNKVDAGAEVCRPQSGAPYDGWRKRLSVAPGVPIYYSYLPNGHIVKDKMGRGTQQGIYWTGKVGEKLSNTKQITPDRLVNGNTFDYDDGNCGETVDYNGQPGGRAGDGKPCIGSFTIPQGTPDGIYHFVWYWTFYREDGNYADANFAKGYFGASYSTCFEVEVTGSAPPPPPAEIEAPPAPPTQTEAPEPPAETEAPPAPPAPPTQTEAPEPPAETEAPPAPPVLTQAPPAQMQAPVVTPVASIAARSIPPAVVTPKPTSAPEVAGDDDARTKTTSGSRYCQ